MSIWDICCHRTVVLQVVRAGYYTSMPTSWNGQRRRHRHSRRSNGHRSNIRRRCRHRGRCPFRSSRALRSCPACDEQLHTLRPLWRQATPAGHITGALCLLHHWLATPASAAAAVIRSDIVQSYHRCTLTNTQSWCRATLLIAVGHCRSNLHVQLIHPPCIHASMQPISPMHPAPMQYSPRHHA